MTLHDRLRQLVSALPPAGAVTLTRADLAALLESDGADVAAATRDLSVEDVAAETGRKPSTVRGWLISGALRGYKLNGRDWRVTRAALREYLERQVTGPAVEQGEDVDITAWRRVSAQEAAGTSRVPRRARQSRSGAERQHAAGEG